MRRLSQDEIAAAQHALAEHTEAAHTSNNLLASATQNDYRKSPTLWNGATANINTAVVLEEEKRLGRDLTFAEKKQLSAAKG